MQRARPLLSRTLHYFLGRASRALEDALKDVSAHPDVREKPQADHYADHRGPSVAQQRQSDAGHWQQSNHHSNIFKHLPEDHRGDPYRSEGAKPVARVVRNLQREDQNHSVEAEQQEACEKSMLLRPDREDEVGVLLGKKKKSRLGAVSPALTGQSARSHGYLRLRGMIIGSLQV